MNVRAVFDHPHGKKASRCAPRFRPRHLAATCHRTFGGRRQFVAREHRLRSKARRSEPSSSSGTRMSCSPRSRVDFSISFPVRLPKRRALTGELHRRVAAIPKRKCLDRRPFAPRRQRGESYTYLNLFAKNRCIPSGLLTTTKTWIGQSGRARLSIFPVERSTKS